MNKLYYSPAARDDLSGIKEYIEKEFANPVSAENIVKSILKKIRNLERFPEIGAPLAPIIGIETDYRVLSCGNYLAFYRVENKNVHIIRILYGKRDYCKILFGDLTREERE